MTRNTQEADFWSGPAGSQWIEHEAEQDWFLSEVATAVLEKANPRPGARVLDIGCGTGAVSLLCADAVGVDGFVLATDIAAPFVERVRARAAHLPQVSTHLGDAQSASWPVAAFDLALSRFGVMFFSDPSAAFANIARAMRSGGRMVFAAWGPVSANPYWQIPRDLVDEIYGPQERSAPNSPGPMGLADANWAVAQFKAAGLTDLAFETRQIHLLHNGGAAGVASLGLRIGSAARAMMVAKASDEEIEVFRAKSALAYGPFEAEDGIARVPATIHLYTARTG
ncbi:MAG: methyltransferase domain-containing protein [Pseudomonadota bacterium]